MNKSTCFFLHFMLYICTPLSEVCGQEESRHSFAGTIVKGTITDEKGTPMQYATVSASYSSTPAIPVKGTITSRTGLFQLELPAGKDFLISTRFLGYRDSVYHLRTNAPVIDLGQLVLRTRSQQLDQVTVKPSLTVNADRIIYNFENDEDRATSNLMKIIRKMPLILVDDITGKIYVESETKTYIVLRNGRIDALFSNSTVTFDQMLEKLPAMGFTQFEIWQQPPLRYQQYDYVINIITDKTQRVAGVVGTSAASHYFDDMSTTLRQGFTGSASDLRFSGDLAFINEHRPLRKESIYTQYYATGFQPEISIHQEKSFRTDRQRYPGNLVMSYDLSGQQFINLSFGYSRDNIDKAQDLQTDSSFLESNASYQNQVSDQTQYTNYQLGINYQYDFVPGGRVLNISYSMNQRPIRNTQEITQTATSGTDHSTALSRLRNQKDNTHKFQIDYTDNFADSRFTLDCDLGYLIKVYDDYSRSYNLISQLEDENLYTATRQQLHRIDGYAELKWNPTDNLSLTGKIIADYLPGGNTTRLTYGQYSESIAQYGLLYSPVFKARYIFTTPTAGEPDFMDALSLQSSLELSYQLTRNRPDPQQMSNYTDVSNPNWIKRGNPDLKPERYHNLYLRLSLGLPENIRISPGFSYGCSNNKIIPYSSAEITPDQTRMIESYRNTKVNHYNINLQANYGIKIRINTMFMQKHEHTSEEKNINSILSVSGGYNFDALKIVRIATTVNYNKYFNNGNRGLRISHPLGLSFSLISKRLKIGNNYLDSSISFQNILNWNKSKSIQSVQTEKYTMEAVSQMKKLPIAVNISYNFGKFKVKPVKNTRKKTEINGFSTEK